MMASKPLYSASDVIVILGVQKTKAYQIIKALREELNSMKVPGKNIRYALPPAGKIPASFFCEKYCLDRDECDEYLEKAG